MISIIVPCYNAEEEIDATLDSLMSQSGSGYQIVLVDDGSTDNTPLICDEYSGRDSRIKVIHQENSGLMGAWKRGVSESDGEYIGFCDADDHIDEDFIEKISAVIDDYDADIIAFGMISEFPNGDSTRVCNRLKKGYYDKEAINTSLLPELLSDGSMQSEMIIKSRWTKVFRKSVLMSVIPALSDKVSLGEDQLTMFATMQIAGSLYCMGDYCPYHYVRHTGSMIGRFDKMIFDKIEILYNEMNTIADSYSYQYRVQLLYDRLSVTLVYVKKYLCKSRDGYIKTIREIKRVRESSGIVNCVSNCSIRKYATVERVFAGLFIRRIYPVLYFVSRLAERLRGHNV